MTKRKNRPRYVAVSFLHLVFLDSVFHLNIAKVYLDFSSSVRFVVGTLQHTFCINQLNYSQRFSYHMIIFRMTSELPCIQSISLKHQEWIKHNSLLQSRTLCYSNAKHKASYLYTNHHPLLVTDRETLPSANICRCT